MAKDGVAANALIPFFIVEIGAFVAKKKKATNSRMGTNF
jgi:hypothetical protein